MLSDASSKSVGKTNTTEASSAKTLQLILETCTICSVFTVAISLKCALRSGFVVTRTNRYDWSPGVRFLFASARCSLPHRRREEYNRRASPGLGTHLSQDLIRQARELRFPSFLLFCVAKVKPKLQHGENLQIFSNVTILIIIQIHIQA